MEKYESTLKEVVKAVEYANNIFRHDDDWKATVKVIDFADMKVIVLTYPEMVTMSESNDLMKILNGNEYNISTDGDKAVKFSIYFDK